MNNMLPIPPISNTGLGLPAQSSGIEEADDRMEEVVSPLDSILEELRCLDSDLVLEIQRQIKLPLEFAQCLLEILYKTCKWVRFSPKAPPFFHVINSMILKLYENREQIVEWNLLAASVSILTLMPQRPITKPIQTALLKMGSVGECRFIGYLVNLRLPCITAQDETQRAAQMIHLVVLHLPDDPKKAKAAIKHLVTYASIWEHRDWFSWYFFKNLHGSNLPDPRFVAFSYALALQPSNWIKNKHIPWYAWMKILMVNATVLKQVFDLRLFEEEDGSKQMLLSDPQMVEYLLKLFVERNVRDNDLIDEVLNVLSAVCGKSQVNAQAQELEQIFGRLDFNTLPQEQAERHCDRLVALANRIEDSQFMFPAPTVLPAWYRKTFSRLLERGRPEVAMSKLMAVAHADNFENICMQALPSLVRALTYHFSKPSDRESLRLLQSLLLRYPQLLKSQTVAACIPRDRCNSLFHFALLAHTASSEQFSIEAKQLMPQLQRSVENWDRFLRQPNGEIVMTREACIANYMRAQSNPRFAFDVSFLPERTLERLGSLVNSPSPEQFRAEANRILSQPKKIIHHPDPELTANLNDCLISELVTAGPEFLANIALLAQAPGFSVKVQNIDLLKQCTSRFTGNFYDSEDLMKCCQIFFRDKVIRENPLAMELLNYILGKVDWKALITLGKMARENTLHNYILPQELIFYEILFKQIYIKHDALNYKIELFEALGSLTKVGALQALPEAVLSLLNSFLHSPYTNAQLYRLVAAISELQLKNPNFPQSSHFIYDPSTLAAREIGQKF